MSYVHKDDGTAIGDNNAMPVVSIGKKVKDEIILQNAIVASGNGTAIYMGDSDTFKITGISGTSTSRTIIFEVSNAQDGVFSLIQGVRLSDLSMATQTTNLNEIWQLDGLAGLWFRARVSTISGGNLTIKGRVIA